MLNIIQNTIGALQRSASTQANLNFEFTVNTANAGTLNTQFQLPLLSNGVISIDVDWGDGSSDTITAYNQAETLHTYSSSGVYTIKIANEVRGWSFNFGGDRLKIIDVSNCGEFNITTDSTFYGCSNMAWTATDAPTISLTNFYRVFKLCSSFNGTIDNWDMGSVTSISQMFDSCTIFNQPLNSWDTSSMTDFSYAFTDCGAFNQPLSNWNTGLVASMFRMFRNSSAFDQDISSWDVSSLTTADKFKDGTVGFSTTNYDKILIYWEPQALNPGVTAHFGTSKYTGGGVAATAHASLTDAATNNWTIIDGGIA